MKDPIVWILLCDPIVVTPLWMPRGVIGLEAARGLDFFFRYGFTAGKHYSLRDVHDGFLNNLRQLKFRKPCRRVQVVFAALIDNVYVAVLGGIIVREHTVNLVQFQ